MIQLRLERDLEKLKASCTRTHSHQWQQQEAETLQWHGEDIVTMFLPQSCQRFTRMLLLLEWLTTSTSSKSGHQGATLDHVTPISVFIPHQLRTLKAKRASKTDMQARVMCKQ